jgi:hypothetical protein
MRRAFVVHPEILFEPKIAEWMTIESMESLIGQSGVCNSPPIETPIGDILICCVPGHSEPLNVFASVLAEVGQWAAGCVHGNIAIIGRHRDLSDDDVAELMSLHSYIQDSILRARMDTLGE